MKIAVYHNNKDIRIKEAPIPDVNENEILVKVMASGICGSDVMEWYRIKKAPCVLGHEATGEIIKVGRNVKKYKVGQRVFVSHHVPCGNCRWCASYNHTLCDTLRMTNYYPGGFSEYILVPEINVKTGTFILPRNISYEEGVFIEPLACVLRSCRKANIHNANSILIVGCGISGILHIAVCKILGVKKIIAVDINKYRLRFAEKFGADKVYLKKPDKNVMVDRIVFCTNSQDAVYNTIHQIERGGIVLFFAPFPPESKIYLPLNKFYFDGITTTSSYGASPYDIEEAIDILSKKKIKVKDMITHRLSLKNIKRGFRIVERAKKSLKVIIVPSLDKRVEKCLKNK